MPYAPLDDRFDEAPSNAELNLAELGAYACSITYCTRHLTDGRFPRKALRMWGTDGCSPEVVAKMIAVGKWRETDDGYQIVSFLKWNNSRRKVERLKRGAARRVREHRRKKVEESRDSSRPAEAADVTRYVTRNEQSHYTTLQLHSTEGDPSGGPRPAPRKVAKAQALDPAIGTVIATYRAAVVAKTGVEPNTSGAGKAAKHLLDRFKGDLGAAKLVIERAVRHSGETELHVIARYANRWLTSPSLPRAVRRAAEDPLRRSDRDVTGWNSGLDEDNPKTAAG